jgi:mannose-1-phosphate guanylyltransferase
MTTPTPAPDAFGPAEHDPSAPFTDAFASTWTADAVGTLPAEEPEADPLLGTGLSLWAVVFAGGIGSRFWPMSSPERPKQLLALVGDRPLIAGHDRAPLAHHPARAGAGADEPRHRRRAARAIPEVPDANMLVEPRPMGTAAALAWGAQEIARRVGPKTVFCAMHADLACAYPQEMRRLITRAAGLASSEQVLVTLGAEPTRPETGFGYVLPDLPIDADVGRSAGARAACRASWRSRASSWPRS